MKHNIFHHLVMVVYSEIINLVWLAVGVALSIGWWVIFNFSDRVFWELVVGGPLILGAYRWYFLKFTRLFW